ncbi:DUF2169 family type VI secretion system accessory protein [Xanthobacter agilis]|uniref:DUF2169 family type VI secretion system accessory protein n=1 Tax=Xanthobacter agilis TaxID=47492 RepID=UPI003726487C
MPLMIKPRTLGLLHKVERRRDGGRFIVTVLVAFDLADSSRLDGEQGLWTMAAATLPPGTPLDMGMPKPRAEMLIAGRVQAPDAGALLLEARIGGVHRRLAVFGDRWWTTDAGGRYLPTDPQPLTDLLLSRARAFGGPGHPGNGEGLGFGAVDRIGAGGPIPLPNIEDPRALIHSILDQPEPMAFGPLDVLDPRRQQLAGTYDAAWARDVAPALADDIHPDFFMVAPCEQWLPGYFNGDEPYWLHNFSADAPLIEGRLPGIAPRAFVGRGDAAWSEVGLALDTVWLVAGARRGILAWHGVLPVADIEGRDVTDVMVAYERLGAPPRPLSHYAEVRRVRCDPETAPRFAFSEWQLTPPKDPAEIARRDAARLARAQQQAELQAEAMAYVTTRALDAAGVPEILRPAPLPPAEPMPLPTPEELAAGDFDLGEMLDLIEAKGAKAHADAAALAERGQPVLEAMQALQAPDAGPREVDALLAALVPLTGQDVAGELDQAHAAGGAALPEGALPEGLAALLPPVASAALPGDAGPADWRQLLADNLKGGDDAAVLAAALARCLRLPEGRPLAAARAALDAAAGMELPSPPAADPASGQRAAEAVGPSVTSLLDALLADPDAAPAAAQVVTAQVMAAKEKLGEAGRQIQDLLPRLGAVHPSEAIDRLLAELVPAGAAAAGAVDLQDLSAHRDAAVADALRQVDAAEARLETGVAELRRMAPKSSYPQVPLAPRVARRFGDAVLEQLGAGLTLAGRDLAGVDLAGADLSGLDLSGAFLERANLANARLRGANLSGAVLTQARLDHADFTDADLTGANLSAVSGHHMRLDGVRLSEGLLLEARLTGASARRAVFTGVRFLSCDLTGADFTEARFEDGLFMSVKAAAIRLERATLRRCQIMEGDFTGACLDGSFVDRCSLLKLTAPGVSAVRADWRGSAFLGGALLSGLDFSEGLASEASFYGADLTGAVFRRAICERTVFNAAQLAGADFHLASLRFALLDGANLADADLAGAQLMEAQLHRANLTGATFRHANLFGADLTDADLRAADFTLAHLLNSPLALETVHD